MAMIQDFKQYANAVHPKKSGKNLFVLATDASTEGSFMYISSLSGHDVQMYNGAILTTAPIITQGFTNHKIEAMVKL